MAVDRLLNFYPPLDVADPRVFIAGIGAVLAKYPPELITAAVSPDGIPVRLTTLRSLAEIDEVCRDLYAPIARQRAREAIARQPRQLPRPRRTPEEQARVDEQVARWRAGRP